MRRQNHGLAGNLDDRHQFLQRIDVHFVYVPSNVFSATGGDYFDVTAGRKMAKVTLR
jgi:hypothetical protein